MDDKRPTPYARLHDHSAAAFNHFGEGYLPGHLGIEIVSVEPGRLVASIPVRTELMAPNGYLHAGTLVVAADSLCGYGCIVNLPEGASGFTTIELKSNFLGTLREGTVRCEASPLHLGRTTQVWDATLTDAHSDKLLATFRCTQLILWKRV